MIFMYSMDNSYDACVGYLGAGSVRPFCAQPQVFSWADRFTAAGAKCPNKSRNMGMCLL